MTHAHFHSKFREAVLDEETQVDPIQALTDEISELRRAILGLRDRLGYATIHVGNPSDTLFAGGGGGNCSGFSVTGRGAAGAAESNGQ